MSSVVTVPYKKLSVLLGVVNDQIGNSAALSPFALISVRIRVRNISGVFGALGDG